MGATLQRPILTPMVTRVKKDGIPTPNRLRGYVIIPININVNIC